MQGIRKINKTLDIFTKIEKGLNEGVCTCISEKEDRYNHIKTLNQEVKEIETSENKARKVLTNLQKIFGE